MQVFNAKILNGKYTSGSYWVIVNFGSIYFTNHFKNEVSRLSIQMIPEIVAWIACTNSLRSTDLMGRRIDLFTVISFLVIFLSLTEREMLQ